MKKQLLAVLLLLSFALPASASMDNDFKDNFNVNALADYNRDISTLMGQADFHTSKGITFPGFDIGATMTAVHTSGDNFSGKDYFYAPFITAETRLPVLDLGVAVRGTSYDGFKSLGGGVKWNQSVTFLQLAAGLFYDRFGTDYYDGNHYSASASASMNVLMLTPYVGLGYDYSTLKVKDLPPYSGKSTHDGTMRYTAGVNVHPIPFLYFYGAYTYTKYNHGFQGGLGLSF